MAQCLKQESHLSENIIFLITEMWLQSLFAIVCLKTGMYGVKILHYSNTENFRWPWIVDLRIKFGLLCVRVSCPCVRHKGGWGGGSWGIAPRAQFLITRWKLNGPFHSPYLGKRRIGCWVGLTAGVDIQEEKGLSLSGIELLFFWRIACSLVAVPARQM